MNYSFLITLKKVIKQVVIVLITLLANGLLATYPQYAQFQVWGGLTIYAILVALADYLKHRWGVNIP